MIRALHQSSRLLLQREVTHSSLRQRSWPKVGLQNPERISSCCFEFVACRQLQQPSLARSCRFFSSSTDGEGKGDTSKDQGEEESEVNIEFEKRNPPRKKRPKGETLDPTDFPTKVVVRMPDMGEGEGMVIKWFKKPGDVIQYGDVLCDIQTDDFTFGMSTDDEHDVIMGDPLVELNSKVGDHAAICETWHPLEEGGKEDAASEGGEEDAAIEVSEEDAASEEETKEKN